MRFSKKWSKRIDNGAQEMQSRLDHVWNGSWALPLLQSTHSNDVKYQVLKTVYRLLLSSDLYCLSYESSDIVKILHEWLEELFNEQPNNDNNDDDVEYTLFCFILFFFYCLLILAPFFVCFVLEKQEGWIIDRNEKHVSIMSY